MLDIFATDLSSRSGASIPAVLRPAAARVEADSDCDLLSDRPEEGRFPARSPTLPHVVMQKPHEPPLRLSDADRSKRLPVDPQHDQVSDRSAEDPAEDETRRPDHDEESKDKTEDDLTPLPLDQPRKPETPDPQTDGPLS